MKVLVHGQLIEYKKEGKGSPVLLLHGWGSSLATFDELAAYFVKKKHTVYRFDFPGFGGSPAPATAWSVGDYVAITQAFIAKMKLKHIDVIAGHSFGGRVIIKGVATGALDAHRLVLMGAAGIKPRRSAKKLAITIVAKVGKAALSLPGLGSVREKMRGTLYAAAGSTDYLQAGAMQQIFLNTIREDLRHYLPEVAIPTTLIWGENDTETPVRDGEIMQREMQQADLHVISEAGHFVYADAFPTVCDILDRELTV